jgi:hypothetical protein
MDGWLCVCDVTCLMMEVMAAAAAALTLDTEWWRAQSCPCLTLLQHSSSS